jgi:hypothetical protein
MGLTREQPETLVHSGPRFRQAGPLSMRAMAPCSISDQGGAIPAKGSGFTIALVGALSPGDSGPSAATHVLMFCTPSVGGLR